MDQQLRRLLALAKRTGDRLIITDPDGLQTYVLMGLDQYESLMGLKAKISSTNLPVKERPISRSVKAAPPASEFPPLIEDVDEDEVPTDIWDVVAPADRVNETWDLAKMSQEERLNVQKQFELYKNREKAKNQPPIVASQPVSPVIDEDDFGEEQFYLEPVE